MVDLFSLLIDIPSTTVKAKICLEKLFCTLGLFRVGKGAQNSFLLHFNKTS